jgi:putative ABC transport system permease protein
LLTEGIVIGILGGGLGVLLTYAGIRLVSAGLSFNDAVHDVPVRLDTNVLLFAMVVSLVSALLSSIAPALKVSRTNIGSDLAAEGRTVSGGKKQSRLRNALVGGEIALAFTLLVGSGLLIRGIYVLEHQAIGFRHDHLLTAGMTIDQARYSDASRQIQFVRSLVPSLRSMPGVEDAAVVSDLPATGPGSVPFHIKGQPESPAVGAHSAVDVVVTPEYFRVAGIPLLRGRTLVEQDDATAPRVVLVNQEFVHRFLQDHDPIGTQIQLDITGSAPAWREIVGVVSDVKSFSEDVRIDPEVYETFLQRPVASLSLMLRTNAEPNSLIPDLRRLVSGLDADLPLLRVMSMDGVIDTQRKGNSLFTGLLATFAMLALLMASIGIYGLISYSVGQRTHEMGIRVALGAKTSDISKMILRQGFKLAAVGSFIGLALALPLPKLFDSIFMGLLFSAPEVYPIVFVAIFIVTIIATYAPARRASRVNPASALRNE